jgi:hypothetical protein
VKPKKQPLLANGYETTFVSRKQLSKHVPAAMDKHAAIEVLLETVFLVGPCKGSIRKTIGATESVLYGRL